MILETVSFDQPVGGVHNGRKIGEIFCEVMWALGVRGIKAGRSPGGMNYVGSCASRRTILCLLFIASARPLYIRFDGVVARRGKGATGTDAAFVIDRGSVRGMVEVVPCSLLGTERRRFRLMMGVCRGNWLSYGW